MAGGIDYNKVAHGTPIMAWTRQPPPSPLQQWFGAPSKPNLPNGYKVGLPVRVCHLLSPEVRHYNDLVGDIYDVETIQNNDGTQEVLFEVRCPVLANSLANLVDEQDYYKKPFSPSAQSAMAANRAKLAGAYGAGEMDDSRLPPFVLLTRLPSEKLEPLNNAAKMSLMAYRAGISSTDGGDSARVPGMTSQPAPLVLDPKWGPPMPAVRDKELPAREFVASDEPVYYSLAGSHPAVPITTVEHQTTTQNVAASQQFTAASMNAPMPPPPPMPVATMPPALAQMGSMRYANTGGSSPMDQQPQTMQPQTMQPLPALAPPPVWDGPPTPPLSAANGGPTAAAPMTTPGSICIAPGWMPPSPTKLYEQVPRTTSNVSTNMVPEANSFYAYHGSDLNRGSARFSQGSTTIAQIPGRTTSFYSDGLVRAP